MSKFEPNENQSEYILTSFLNKEKTAKELANEFGIGKNTVYSFLKRNGVNLVQSKDIKSLGLDHYNSKYKYDHEFILFLLEKGYCLEHMSQITGIPYGSLSLYLTNNNLKRNIVTDKVTPFQYKMIVDKYKSGMTVEKSIEGFDLHIKTVCGWLTRYEGIEMRKSFNYEREVLSKEFFDIVPNQLAYGNLKQEIIDFYLEGNCLYKTCKKYKMCCDKFTQNLKDLGILRTKSEALNLASGVEYNSSAFSDFTEENASYFYGFLLADGCLGNSGKTIQFTVKDTDSELLYKVANYVCKGREPLFSQALDKRTNKVYKRCTFNFSNPLIIERLVEQNLESNKSGKEKLPKFDWINNKHFWRGLIDGDGHVGKRINTLCLVGSREVCEGFLSFVEHMIGLKTKRKLSEIKGKTCNYCKVVLTGEDSINAMKYLYEDAEIYLTRKYNAAMERIQLWQQHNKS